MAGSGSGSDFRFVCAATWPFGQPAAEEAGRRLAVGAKALDALEAGLNVVELDPASGPYFVGRGGLPNAAGATALDAACMRGSDCALGAVAALEHTPQFAAAQGMCKQTIETDASRAAFAAHQEKQKQKQQPQQKAVVAAHTDTLSAVALDVNGNVSAAVTTSGTAFKAVGRVGDSPIAGSGLYADSEAGAAVATGDGDHIMRFCPCARVVDLMAAGMSPREACEEVIGRIAARLRRTLLRDCSSGVSGSDDIGRGGAPMFEMALLAVSSLIGEVSAASTFGNWRDHVTGERWNVFSYAVVMSDDFSTSLATAAATTSEVRVCPSIDAAVLRGQEISRQL